MAKTWKIEGDGSNGITGRLDIDNYLSLVRLSIEIHSMIDEIEGNQ